MECTKKSYLTVYEAQKALAKMDIARQKGNFSRHEQFFYKCPECNLYHLTSNKSEKAKKEETELLERIELESQTYKSKNRKKLKKRK